MKIKFVTDSVADLPQDWVDQWDVGVVPCYINYGGKSYADDGVELVREDYYTMLAQGVESDYPSTAAMSPEVAREAIDRAAADADHVIMITTPAKLSAIYNNFKVASAHLPMEKMTLIDSGQLSLGMGWQVMAGVETAAETGDLDKTLAAIHTMREAQRIYATIGSLEFLRRSGRLSWARASIGTLLNIKPVVELRDGEAPVMARTRTFTRGLDKLAEIVRERAPFDRVAILHINNPEGADSLQAMIADVLPDNVITGLIGPTVGTHIGPGTVGVGMVKKGWNDAIST